MYWKVILGKSFDYDHDCGYDYDYDYYYPWNSFRPKAKQVHIVAVGIGRQYKKFQEQLKEIAGKNVYSANNFDELSDLFDKILAETCSKWTEATPSDQTLRIFFLNLWC